VPGPGKKLFKVFHEVFGQLPFIAEDLGLITPPVEKLRDDLGLPGMRVLHFAFGDNSHNPFLPHNHPRNAVAYTGTHDNDTTVGWFKSLKPAEKKRVASYAPDARRDPAGALLRLAWSSVAELAIAPLQDVLRLDSRARMNTPAVTDGNWAWRATSKQFSHHLLDEVADLTKLYSRTKT
jgi:4-alpha-glucanotransferase